MSAVPVIDLSPTVKGLQIPQLGCGTWKIPKDVVPNVVEESIKAGYRNIDCACDYGNEKEVGQGIAAGISSANLNRSDLFVTSKLWNTFHRPEHVRPAFLKTLSDLGLDYLDLYLIHFPISLKYVPIEKRYPPEWMHDPNDPSQAHIVLDPVPLRDTWEVLESLVDEGLIRHIGVSNFTVILIMDLLASARIRPAVLQVEVHPYLQQQNLLNFCKQEWISVTAFSPFGGAGYVELGQNNGGNLLKELPLVGIAKNHEKSVAQVLLRWAVQRGTVVIPKTSRVERLAENMDIFSWSLSEADMATIASLECGKRYNDPAVFCTGMGMSIPIYD